MTFLGTWLMVFELLAVEGLNKMFFKIDNSTIWYLISTLTGCFKSASFFAKSVTPFFHFTLNNVELF